MEKQTTAEAYKNGFESGLKRGQEGTKFPDGVDWHIIHTECECQIETLPVADNAGEDINLYEYLRKLREETYKNKCETCNKFVKIWHVDGNMASKRTVEAK